MADDSDDDEIIAEYPLYSSTTAALFKTETQDIRVVQLQYPLRPQWRSYDTENMSEVRYKPEHRFLTFKVPEDRPDKVRISQHSLCTHMPAEFSPGCAASSFAVSGAYNIIHTILNICLREHVLGGGI